MQTVNPFTDDGVLGGLPLSIATFALSTFEADVRRLTRNMLKASEASNIVAYQNAAQALANIALDAGAIHLAALAHVAVQSPAFIPNADILAASECAIASMKTTILLQAH